MTVNPRRSMFMGFQVIDEKCLVGVLNGAESPPAMVSAALLSLERCRSEIIEELKCADALSQRRELRVLYEGFTLATEFIQQHESVPAARDD